VLGERQAFIASLAHVRPPTRELIEANLPLIGANGILDGLEAVWPKCHSEAHELGKVIFAHLRDVGMSVQVCAHRCYSGCMHGVVMEALATAHLQDGSPLDIGAVSPLMKSLCRIEPTVVETYSPGDCAHGVGHALMFLADADIPAALNACAAFDNTTLTYYCATGIYMEYVTTHDAQDATSRRFLYPCDVYEYPAACARYKMVHVTRRHYESRGTTEALRRMCSDLTGAVRLGCFHGLGNAHAPWIAAGHIRLKAVCLGIDASEESVCIDGAIERLAKYDDARAQQICDELTNEPRKVCFRAVQNNMYNMEKDLSLYLNK
jgi:hypothetical protein